MLLKDPLSNTNPLIQKQKSKTQSLIKKTKPLIHKKEKKKKKTKDKPKNPNRISQSRFRLIITCNSPLQIHIHTNQTSVFQPIKQTNKKKRLQQWKPMFVLYNSEFWKSLFILCNNSQFRSYPISRLKAINDNVSPC